MPLHPIPIKFQVCIQVQILMFTLMIDKKNHYIYSSTPLEGQGSSIVHKGTGSQYLLMVLFFSTYNVYSCTAMDSRLSWTELFYTTPGIQNALLFLCIANEFCLLLNTVTELYLNEHNLK